jgi:phytoene desaturase
MARVAERAGARIHLSEPVDEILYQGRRATGIRTQRGVTSADAVVVNGDFAHAMRHLVPNRLRPTWNDRKIDKARFSCSTYMLYLGIEGQVDLPHHTIHVPTSYRRNLDEIENRHVLSLDPSVYVQNACVTDPSLAPSGHSTLYVLVPVTHQHEHVDWAREKETYRPVVMRQLQRMGIPDLADRIRYERVITPADWEAQYAIHKGATFNLTHDLGQMLHKRPRNRFSDVDGMYLVGGGTHPGSGLPVIYEGARITSKLVADDLGLGVDWSVPPVSPTSALADVA